MESLTCFNYSLQATSQYHCYPLSKLLERHIQNTILAHFEENHPISTQQCGVTCGKSTTGALRTGCHWPELAQGHDICTAFFDYSKAFDIQFHTGRCCKSPKIMVFTNWSSDGLHIIFTLRAHARRGKAIGFVRLFFLPVDQSVQWKILIWTGLNDFQTWQ